MLVLSRNIGERIRIDDSIELTVLEIRNDRVRLGFCAPPSVPIHREEIYLRICEERAEEARERTLPSPRRHSGKQANKIDRFTPVKNAQQAPRICVTDTAIPALPAAS
jgi:carbon storage regulator